MVSLVNSFGPGRSELHLMAVIFELMLNAWWLKYFLWKKNSDEYYWTLLSDGKWTLVQVMVLVPSGNSQIPKAMLTQIYVAIWHHYATTFDTWNFYSLAPVRYGCNPKFAIFKLISSIDILSISFENAHRWMPQNLTDDHLRLVNTGPSNGCQARSHYLNKCWLYFYDGIWCH